jgi:host factor-I protein
MNRNESGIQYKFLTDIAAEHRLVWVYLVNGVKLTGTITAFDKYVLRIEAAGSVQTVYKSSVSTIIEQHAQPPRLQGRGPRQRERHFGRSAHAHTRADR